MPYYNYKLDRAGWTEHLRDVLKQMLLSLFFLMVLTFGPASPTCSGSEDASAVVIFPKYSIGNLHLVRNAELTWNPVVDQKMYAEARGSVRVPFHTKLRLILNHKGSETEALSNLEKAPVGAIYGIDAGNMESFNDTSMNEVAKIVGLRELQLLNTEVTSKGLNGLQRLTRLEKLHLGETNVDSRCIPMIARLKSLVVLNLHLTDLKGADLSPLAQLSKLRILNISNSRLSSFTGISKIQSLEELVVCGNKDYTDADVMQLKALKHLSALNICDTSVTEACIPALKSMNLKVLEVSWPPQVVARLKKEMPNTLILARDKPRMSPSLFAPLH